MTMNPDLERRAMEVLEQIYSLDESGREAELGQLDPILARRVRQLYARLSAAGNFLEIPVLDLSATATPTTSLTSTIPDQESEAGVPPPIPRFSWRRRLGAGAFGIVYEAFDHERQSLVAVKHLRHSSAYTIFRFKQEFRALQELFHPNLVSLLELYTENTRWFLLMELLEGLDLVTYLLGRGVDETRAVFRQLAEGVQTLHRAGKLHRDLKPTNILVTAEGKVKILDFGLVTEVEAAVTSVHQSRRAGTPAYMSPEQMRGLPLTQGSDWYSVGIMLYEVLTGRVPSEATGLIHPSTQLHELPAATPTDLARLCRGLLDADAHRRQSAIETWLETLAPGMAGTHRPWFFVGRNETLTRLESVVSRVEAREGQVVYVQGSSGVGKSTTIRHFLDQIRSRQPETICLTHRCHMQESVPFKMLDGVVDLLAAHLKKLPTEDLTAITPPNITFLVQMFPILRQVKAWKSAAEADRQSMVENRGAGFTALREVLVRMADQQPLVIFIDDIHCGDIDSLSFLSEWLKPMAPLPKALLILAFRREELETSPVLKILLNKYPPDGNLIHNLELMALTGVEARNLVQSLAESKPTESSWDIERVVSEAGGNPFLIEVLAGMTGNETEELTLETALRKKVADLSESARRILETTVVAGIPLPRQIIRESASVAEDEVAAMTVLQSQRLVKLSGRLPDEVVEPYHDRIRETLVGTIKGEKRRGIHRALAEQLEKNKSLNPEQMMVHWKEAGESRRALEYAYQAADGAVKGLAFDHAANLYRQTLELLSHAGDLAQLAGVPDQGTLTCQLAVALRDAGRAVESAQTYLQAAELSQGEERLKLQSAACEQYINSGHINEGLELLDSILKKAGYRLLRTRLERVAGILWVRFRIRLRGYQFQEQPHRKLSEKDRVLNNALAAVGYGLSGFDLENWFYLQSCRLLEALRQGEPIQAAVALTWEVSILLIMGEWKRVHSLLEQVRELNERLNDPFLNVSTLAAECQIALHHGEFAKGRTMGVTALNKIKTELPDTGFTQAIFWMWMSLCSVELGDFQLMRQTMEVAAGMERLNETLGVAYIGTLATPFYFLAQGNVEQSMRACQFARSKISSQVFGIYDYWVFSSQARIALYTTTVPDQWDEFLQFEKKFNQSVLGHNPTLKYKFSRLFARLNLQMYCVTDDSQYLTLARSVIGYLEKHTEIALTPAEPVFLTACVLAVTQQPQEAIHLFAKAEDEYRALEMQLDEVIARRCRGRLLKTAEGEKLVAEADGWMRAHGIQDPERFARIKAPIFQM